MTVIQYPKIRERGGYTRRGDAAYYGQAMLEAITDDLDGVRDRVPLVARAVMAGMIAVAVVGAASADIVTAWAKRFRRERR